MQEEISNFLQSRVDAGDFPSAVYLVAEKGEIKFHDAVGSAVVGEETIPARPDTIYDLASLTKPLATGLMISQLIERGDLDPNARIGDLLNEFYISANAEITINQLMMHTSGMPAWKPLYLLAPDAEAVADELAQTLAGSEPDKPVIYSDLNFIALGLILEQTTGEAFPDLFRDNVIGPLEIADTCFNPPAEWRSRIAASEKGNQYEKQTCVELGYLMPDVDENKFRKHLIWGEVHDGNAYFMGGAAGHAGLFGTAEDVLAIAHQFLATHTRLLKPETCDLFRTSFTPGLNEERSFGFQIASTEGSTAGASMSPESFGHNGFTGTSLWIDPVPERVFVLLTNRTHNHPLPFANINAVRRRFHDLAVGRLDENI